MKEGYYQINYTRKIPRTEKHVFTDLKGPLRAETNEEKTHINSYNSEILETGIGSKLEDC